MNAKMAIATVTILAVIATAAFTMIVYDDDDELDIDVVRTDLAVGDYIKFNSDWISDLTNTVDSTRNDYLGGVYWTEEIPSDARTGTWTYDGFEKDCYIITKDVNGTKYDFYVTVDSWIIIHKYATEWGSDIYLDTNMDVGKKMSEQTLTTGTYYGYSTSRELEGVSMDARSARTVLSIDGDSLKVEDQSILRSNRDSVRTVEGFTEDGEVDCGDLDIRTQNGYLSIIDYDSFISYQGGDGSKIVHGEKTQSIIDTFRGKRVVISEKISVIDQDGTEWKYVLHYGLAGAIYIFEAEPRFNGSMGSIETITDTNLMTVKV